MPQPPAPAVSPGKMRYRALQVMELEGKVENLAYAEALLNDLRVSLEGYAKAGAGLAAATEVTLASSVVR